MQVPKKRKKNKLLPLLVLVGIMAVLAIAYGVLSAANDRKGAEAAAAAVSDTTIMLAEKDYTTITNLSYRYGETDWISLDQAEGMWSLTEDKNFPLNQTTVSGMGAAIASIGAMRTVEEGSAADYGLDNPACEIHVTYGSTTYRYAIGDYNTFSGGHYFRDDDGSYYLIASGLLTYFQKDMDDLITLDAPLAAAAEDVVSFTLTYNGETSEITEPDEITAVYDMFCELDLADWTDYYADEAEMAAYGIDDGGTLVITYKRNVPVTDGTTSETTGQIARVDATYTIRFGDITDGMVYYSPKGSTIVYQVSEDVYTGIFAR